MTCFRHEGDEGTGKKKKKKNPDEFPVRLALFASCGFYASLCCCEPTLLLDWVHLIVDLLKAFLWYSLWDYNCACQGNALSFWKLWRDEKGMICLNFLRLLLHLRISSHGKLGSLLGLVQLALRMYNSQQMPSCSLNLIAQHNDNCSC